MSRQLDEILTSGEILDIKIAATGANKSVATKEYADASKASRQYTKQLTPPAHVEGLTFYEDEHRCLSVYTDVVGVTHNLGQETLVRVKNVSGATILNGKVCRMAGSDPVTGFPQAVLAQANSPVNATFLGVATHNIPNNTFGWLTQHGIVHDIDLTGFAANTVLYLSDVTPGALTTTVPSYPTRVGQVLNTGVTGDLLVNAQSMVAQPKLFGMLKSKAATMDLTTSYQNIAGYTTKKEINVAGNITNGTITPSFAGTYRANLNFTLTVPSSALTRTIDLQVWDTTHSTELGVTSITVSKDATVVSRSVGLPIDPDANDAIVVRIKASDAMAGVAFTYASFDLESIFVNP